MSAQGRTANRNGRALEKLGLKRILGNYHEPPTQLKNSSWLAFDEDVIQQPQRHTLLTQVRDVSEHWLGTDSRADLISVRPDFVTTCVEFRTQSKTGSVIEKLPFLIMKMLLAPTDYKIIVLEGALMKGLQGSTLTTRFLNGFRPLLSFEAIEALLSGQLQIMTLDEFVAWHSAFIDSSVPYLLAA
jgi:hypothetical protein